MCGRFSRTDTPEDLAELFEAELVDEVMPEEDVRPTTDIAVVVSEYGRRLRAMRWGFLPDWYESPDSGPLLINARSETIAKKPAFRAACRARRCLIPADGFYEWQALGRRGKRPHWLSPAAGGGVAFAGVWQDWPGPDGVISTCAIVTCAAPPELAEIHSRLPVAILPEDRALWLGEAGHGAARLMTPPPEGWWAVELDRGPPDDAPRLI
ncbi:SOS response-associated peptidase [Pontivivens ytuae]|uniref:Abasic site processing protein n=1 Tax=Pontivivens ytuae TaxID=2789856 RepID=A0A7S9LQE3_9RHOB|nr:SOS response-associated peptidase [Pontivivens ytuae]QPH53369.1 SOS response-associated peptidase [Pontivivens ytuae]